MIAGFRRKLPDRLIIMGHWLKRLENRAIGVRQGPGVRVSPTVRLFQPAKIELGENCGIAAYTVLWGAGGIRIGADTLISTHCAIVSLTHDIEAAVHGKTFAATTVRKPVSIGCNVWLGAHVTVMPGVSIGDGAVIGAGSVVTRDIPPGVVAVGSPARVTRPVPGALGDAAQGRVEPSGLAGHAA